MSRLGSLPRLALQITKTCFSEYNDSTQALSQQQRPFHRLSYQVAMNGYNRFALRAIGLSQS